MKPNLSKSVFGRLPGGSKAHLYTLENANGMRVSITNYGGIITELHVPDRQGTLADVVLGFDNLDQYLGEHPYFGATIGRVANRIAQGRFALDGKSYQLAINNGPNHLHGGLRGFDKVLWKATPIKNSGVKLSYSSPDGEEGYPGRLTVTVTMTLTSANELRLDYSARTNKPTPLNLTNHTYFNLAGRGDILGHELTLDAHYYTPVDETLIPTGEILKVDRTPFDFIQPRTIGSRLRELKGKPRGYDHNFVLDNGGQFLARAARVSEPVSGRVMETWTTEPGMQLYTGNFLDGSLTGKNGMTYRQCGAVCFETQHFPDSVNQPQFPTTVLRPGRIWESATLYKFSTQ